MGGRSNYFDRRARIRLYNRYVKKYVPKTAQKQHQESLAGVIAGSISILLLFFVLMIFGAAYFRP
jgi:hypothetical protein